MDMHNEWVVECALFGFEDARGGVCVERIGAEAVNRLRWKCDEAAVLNDSGGFVDESGGRMDGIDEMNDRAGHQTNSRRLQIRCAHKDTVCIIPLIFTPKEQHR